MAARVEDVAAFSKVREAKLVCAEGAGFVSTAMRLAALALLTKPL